MNDDSSPLSADLFRSSSAQFKQLLPGTHELALLGPDGAVCWSSFDAASLDQNVLERVRAIMASRSRAPEIIDPARALTTIPILYGDEIVGAVLTPIEVDANERLDDAVERISRRLRPLLDRLARQIIRSRERRNDAPRSGPESGEELEWLFELAAAIKQGSEADAIDEVLAAAVERINASFGALAIPEKGLSVTYASRVLTDAGSSRAYRHTQPYLLTYMQRRLAPLVANRPPAGKSAQLARKILAVPVLLRSDRPVGVLTFCKPVAMPDFDRRELYVARHVARLIEVLLASRCDSATGLLTRTAFEQDAEKVIGAYDWDQRHALVYVDIDHLHVLNETFGFDFGDQAIVRIASLLRPPHLPASALSGRIAGDRFVVLLPASDAADAQRFTDSLQREVNKLTVGIAPQRITLSVSCGIADVPATTGALARAMGAAELACRVAKERGRNRSEAYIDVDDSMMRRREDILGVVRLRAALDKDRLQLFAQRIVPLDDFGRTVGIECLVRLVAEDGAIIPPAEFLCTAARYQLSRAVDEWVIRQTLIALEPYLLISHHSDVYVAINLSEQSLRDEAFLRYVEDQVSRTSVAPRQLMFEIAESAAASHPARTNIVIRRLKSLGCRVALDDFGEREDSLTRLKSLRPDRVKIDGGVVRDVLGSVAAESAVRAIVTAANELAIECVAEHVEAEGVARKLREIGARFGQGNSLHAAQPLQDLLGSLSAEEPLQLKRIYESSRGNVAGEGYRG